MNKKDPKAAKGFYSNSDSRRKICLQVLDDLTQSLGEPIEEEIARGPLSFPGFVPADEALDQTV